MTGTTHAIARLLQQGTYTLPDSARLLGIRLEQLEERLALMERQGYLASVHAAPPGEACSCGHCCGSCCQARKLPAPRLFALTPKGERLASRP